MRTWYQRAHLRAQFARLAQLRATTAYDERKITGP
jgi:hypothetical protein